MLGAGPAALTATSLPSRSAAGKGTASLATGALSLAAILIAASAGSAGSNVWISCLFGWWLLVLAAIDYRTFILPDTLTYGLAGCGLVATQFLAPGLLFDHAVGALVGFTILGVVRQAYRHMRNRDGLGLGDAKLLAALGAWVGWRPLPDVIFIAAVGGLLAILARRLFGHPVQRDQAIPFGPFLALGGWLIWLQGGPTLG
jgi:leader peptidase (prepilin peptidase) / N-methyltransferase